MFSLTQDYGAYCSQDNCDVVKRSNVIIISVKPHIFPNLLKEVSSNVRKDHLVVSIASGIQIEAMERVCVTLVPLVSNYCSLQ